MLDTKNCGTSTPALGRTMIRESQHDVSSRKRMYISLVETLADVLEIDPTTEYIELDRYIDPDLVNGIADYDAFLDGRCTKLTFEYKKYTVFCCSCGTIKVYLTSDEPESPDSPGLADD